MLFSALNIVAAASPATSGSEWWWFIFGMSGNVIFGSRFFIQWIHSERHGESRIPTIFWWFSVLGTLVLFTYFLHRREWVALWGNGPQLIPYTRNLILVYRKKRKDAEAAQHVSAVDPSAPAPQPTAPQPAQIPKPPVVQSV